MDTFINMKNRKKEKTHYKGTNKNRCLHKIKITGIIISL